MKEKKKERLRAERGRGEVKKRARKTADVPQRAKRSRPAGQAPRKKKRARNKEFARVTYIFVALFIAMMGYISYFNVVKSRDIISSPYNKRQGFLCRYRDPRKDSGQKWKCAGSDKCGRRWDRDKRISVQ